MLTRDQAEAQILQKLQEIRDIYLRYNPGGQYLNLYLLNNSMGFNNEYWELGRDASRPLDVYYRKEDNI